MTAHNTDTYLIEQPARSNLLFGSWTVEQSIARLQWLVRLRWIAIAGYLLAVVLNVHVLHTLSNPTVLYALGGALLLANCAFWFVNRRLKNTMLRGLLVWTIIEGITDLVALTVMLHYSGGAENPFVFFYIFHTVIANLLFRPPLCYIHTAITCLLFGGLIFVDWQFPQLHVPLHGVMPPDLYQNGLYLLGIFMSVCITLIVTGHLIGRMVGQLQQQTEQRDLAYAQLRQQEHELENSTEEIARLIHRAETEGSFDVRYKNPHLRPCWIIRNCSRDVCPAHGSDNLRCWQTARTFCNQGLEEDSFEACMKCEVYKQARPDKLTEIGESFNNMMYYLQRHARESAELQKQIMHQEKMAGVGRMAAGLAHEIGNPLTSISSLVQYLARKSDDESIRENLAMVNSHIERISKIVRDMVNYSRPQDSGERMIYVNEIVNHVLAIMKYDTRARLVEIKTAYSEDLPMSLGNADELTQVFMNIVHNALDAMPHGGTLTVTTTETNNELHVTFLDTGIGMTEKQMQQIFEPFYTTKEVGQGTGLGLSVSDAIVRRHGGQISVRSCTDGGAAFTVHLPIRKEKAPAHR